MTDSLLSRLEFDFPLGEEVERLIIMARAHADDCDGARAESFHKLAVALERFKKAEARIRELQAEIARLHERLEDNHEYRLKDGVMVRVYVPPGSIPDGIECRNETINLQDEHIRELKAERDAIKRETIERCCEIIQASDHLPSIKASLIQTIRYKAMQEKPDAE